jgi:lipid-A-disaccharide synthase
MPLIYLIAGEQSGDVLGARLMHAMKAIRPDLRFAGIGGAGMAAEGVESLFPMHELAVGGLVEVLPKVFLLRRRINETVADIASRRPDVVVTIDAQGFAVRVLRRIAGLGLKRAHYVAPQVWAWRERRVKHYPGLWDSLLCLLPFEPAYFAKHGLSGIFVGHPVLESDADTGNGAAFRARHGIAADALVLTVMPGSRRGEVAKLMPTLGETLRRLPAGVIPVVPLAGPVAEAVRAGTDAWPVRPILVTDIAEKVDAFAASNAALTKSGTSTLELALAGVPMVVTYRINPITAWIVRRTLKVKYASLLNLLAGREVIPELIQEDCTPDKLAAVLRTLLTDASAGPAQVAGYWPMLDALRPAAGLPSEAAAAAVLGLLPAG